MKQRRSGVVGMVAALSLGACAGTPPSHFYLLGAAPDGPAADGPAARVEGGPVEGGPLLLVDPVTVAAYADRSQMVTRLADGEVRFSEFTVWAEPVGSLITAALVDDLGARLGPDRVMATPSRLDFSADYRLAVDVLQFDVDPAGQAVLDARWTLLAGADEHFLATGRERLAEPVADPTSYPERVAALDRAVAGLAQRVGRRIGGAKGAAR
jgi:uncharacterized lipoprotein YmbA